MQGTNRSIDFRRVITALLDQENPFPNVYLRQFSDMERSQLEQLKDVWDQIDVERRVELLRALVSTSTEDTLVCFDLLAKFALTDSDPRVRSEAIRLLEECADPKVAVSLIDMMQHDVDAATRAVAASALGLFEYLGELQEIPEDIYHQVEDSLMEVVHGSDLPSVRRKALESLGYSSNAQVIPVIESAYETGEEEWMASALMAMGRSLDKRWAPDVLVSLRSQLHPVRLLSVTAAGLLELPAARQPLLQMLEDPDQLPDPLRRAVIWSLTQIGGEDVGAALEYLLENTEDASEVEFLEEALDNLEFTEGFPTFDLMDFDPELTSAVVEEADTWPEPRMMADEDAEDENEADIDAEDADNFEDD